MKDKKMEEEKRGQPNFEHLDEDLHVLIMVEDTDDRARMKLKKAVEEVNFLLTPPVSLYFIDYFIYLKNLIQTNRYYYNMLLNEHFRKMEKMLSKRNNYKIWQF